MFTKTSKTKLSLVGAEPADRAFWSVDGHIFHNLVEMRDALAAMTNAAFAYHVNRDKNDFAVWAGEVAKDAELAKTLKTKRTRLGALHAVVERLRDYQI